MEYIAELEFAPSSSTAVDLKAGTMAGVGQLLVGHPFDTVKVKLQSMPGKYTGPMDASRQILRNHGPKGFFKGLAAPLVTVAAVNAVIFSARGRMEKLLAHVDGSPLTLWEHALCGGAAGLASSVVACPTEHIKCRLQAIGKTDAPTGGALSKAKPGPLTVIRQVVSVNGYMGLYRGMLPTVLREVPGTCFMFSSYEGVKLLFAQQQGVDVQKLGTVPLIVAGGVSGVAYWASVYPFDVIKSKIQTDNLLNPQYKGLLDCAKQVLQTQGAKGLFAGFSTAIVRSVPANAAAFALFEFTKSHLTKGGEEG